MNHEQTRANGSTWDRMVPLLLAERASRRSSVRDGRSVLGAHELKLLPDVQGLHVLCPFCGTGEETVSLALGGAIVFASDLSANACKATADLARSTGVQIDIETGECLEVLKRKRAASFDLLYISRGVLPWILDMSAFFAETARVLRRGGSFFCYDGHPVAELLEIHAHDGVAAPKKYETHCVAQARLWLSDKSSLDDAPNFQWFRPLSTILNAAHDVGLNLCRFEEHPFHFYNHSPSLIDRDGLFWPSEDHDCPFPLSFSLAMVNTNPAPATDDASEDDVHFVPGPVPVRGPVRLPLASQVELDEGPEFCAALTHALTLSCGLFGPGVGAADIVICPGGGHAINEAALRTIRPLASSAVVVVAGFWGARIADIAEAVGFDVTRVKAEPGTNVSASTVEKAVRESGAEVLVAVMVETSTGVYSPVEELGKIATKTGCFLVVDGVSGVGGYVLDSPSWGVDILTTVSGKAIGAPPGLALAFLSKRIRHLSAGNSRGTFYWDLLKWMANPDGQRETIGTFYPNLLRSLVVALCDLGLPDVPQFHANVRRKHATVASFRRDIRAMGYTVLASDVMAAATVTAVAMTEEEASRLKSFLALRSCEVGGSILPSHRGLVRLGHMGMSSDVRHTTRLKKLMSDFLTQRQKHT